MILDTKNYTLFLNCFDVLVYSVISVWPMSLTVKILNIDSNPYPPLGLPSGFLLGLLKRVPVVDHSWQD